jgi:hypothetical protein
MLRRNQRAMNSLGAVRLSHVRDWKTVEASLPTFIRAQVARFLGTQRLSNLLPPERRHFLNELAFLLSQEDWFCLTQFTVDEAPVAWNYGYQFAGSWFWYLPTFDGRVEECSPGFIMLSRIVAEACDDPAIHVVDLGLGAEGYKDRFANAIRRTCDVRLDRSALPHLVTIMRYNASALVKKYPRFEGRVRAVIARVASLRKRHKRGGLSNLLMWALRRLGASILSSTEVIFCSWAGEASSLPADFNFQSLDVDTLATAALSYADDDATLAYLMRSAERLKDKSSVGFALFSKGEPVHFCWLGAFEGFFTDELRVQLTAPDDRADLIFDCWTPSLGRGRGYYGIALAAVARRSLDQGRNPWIFSATTNAASVRGIEKSGFQPAYLLVRRKLLFYERLRRIPISTKIQGGPLANAAC